MIHTTTINETRDVVCVYDGAIDHAASDLDAYKRTLDMSHLIIRDGAQPTVFALRSLTGTEQRQCLQRAALGVPDADIGARHIGLQCEYFLQGVERIDHLDDETPRVSRAGSQRLPVAVTDRIPPVVQMWLGAIVERLGEGTVESEPISATDQEK